MGRERADRAQRREVYLGAALLFLFGCSVLVFFVAQDRLPWMSADHGRATLTKAASKVNDGLGRKVAEKVAE